MSALILSVDKFFAFKPLLPDHSAVIRPEPQVPPYMADVPSVADVRNGFSCSRPLTSLVFHLESIVCAQNGDGYSPARLLRFIMVGDLTEKLAGNVQGQGKVKKFFGT